MARRPFRQGRLLHPLPDPDEKTAAPVYIPYMGPLNISFPAGLSQR